MSANNLHSSQNSFGEINSSPSRHQTTNNGMGIKVPALSINRYNVIKNTWYKLTVKIHPGVAYKKGILKIFGGTDKNLMFPVVRLPNILFTKNNKAANLEEMKSYDTFEIHFKTDDNMLVLIYVLGLYTKTMSIKKMTDKEIQHEVSLFRMRRLFDLEFINYYLEKNFTNFNPTFIDRFNGEYKLWKFNNYLDGFVSKLSLNLSTLQPSDKKTILYLVYSNIQYEQSAYTMRTQNLLECVNNFAGSNSNVYAVTRYGYPFDRDKNYWQNQHPPDSINGVTYIKLTNKEDNFNDNNLIEYLKKYIVETIKLAHNLNASIIHGCSNFLNGIAAMYAAKYLNIKSVYEVRGFWEWDHQPERYDSDVLKMRRDMENLILQKTDMIVAVSNEIKGEILDRGVDEKKIIVVPDCINMNIYNNDRLLKVKEVNSSSLHIGYIGTIQQSLCDLIKQIKTLQQKNISTKFTIIGSGDLKVNIVECSMEEGIADNIILIDPIDDENLVKYINEFDICFYPVYDTNIKKVMAMKKPIVMYKNDIIEKELPECSSIMYVDKDSLINKIVELFNNKELSEKMGRSSYNYIVDKFGWNFHAKKLIDMYTSS